MSRDGYQTDGRILEAIEAITGGNLDCQGECDNFGCDGMHPENCADDAVTLWRDGGREDEIRAWLDKNYPDWTDDAPLMWGCDELNIDTAPHNGCRCQKCNKYYTVDINIPDNLWGKISRDKNLLCPECIIKNIVEYHKNKYAVYHLNQ